MNLLKNNIFSSLLLSRLLSTVSKKETDRLEQFLRKCRHFGTVKYFRLREHWIMILLRHFILGITQIQNLRLEQKCCCFWTSGHKSMYQCCFSFFSL